MVSIFPTKVPTAARDIVNYEIRNGNTTRLKHAADKHFPAGRMDKLAARISPNWAARRDLARFDRTVMAGGWQITKKSRMHRDRPTGGEGSADCASDDITLFGLRERIRSHDRDSGLLHGMIDRLADNVVGPDYRFRPNSGDEGFDRDAAFLLDEAMKSPETTGRFNFHEVMRLGVRSLQTDGDFLMNHVDDNKFQLIEAHDLVTPFDRKSRDGKRIIGGVEKNSRGQAVGYHIRNPEKDSRFGYCGWVNSTEDTQWLNARNVNHVANRYRFTQTRGIPNFASSLALFESLDSYLASECLAADMAAHLAWSIERDGVTGFQGGQTVLDPNADQNSGQTYDTLKRSEPGLIHDLQKGEKLHLHNPDRPGKTFEPYVIIMLRMIGCGIGIPLELVLLDFSKTTYSSARASLLQSYRTFRIQQNFTDSHIIRPTYNRWMSNWLASGQLSPVGDGMSYKLNIQPSAWPWIDPLKSVLAAEKEIAMGGGTLDEWVAHKAQDFPDVAADRARELEIMRDLKIPSSGAPENLNTGDGNNDNNNGNKNDE